MDQPLIIGLGELLWDCFPDGERPGGAPANFAYHAAQLGCRGAVLSRVGIDHRGDELLRRLADSGVETQWIQRDPTHPTGIVTVDVSRPDRPLFTIHEEVAWDYMELTPEWQQTIQSAHAICFGSLAQRFSTSRGTIQGLLQGQKEEKLVLFDVNLRQQYFSHEIIEQSLRLARLAKVNDEEARVLTQLLELPPGTLRDFGRSMISRYDLEAVCVTRGERGCLMVDRQAMAEETGIPIRVVDTVGAGDAFTAAWLVARLRGWELQRQARFANQVGALVASLPGAMPPVREHYAKLLQPG